jgi:hypothetical protein
MLDESGRLVPEHSCQYNKCVREYLGSPLSHIPSVVGGRGRLENRRSYRPAVSVVVASIIAIAAVAVIAGALFVSTAASNTQISSQSGTSSASTSTAVVTSTSQEIIPPNPVYAVVFGTTQSGNVSTPVATIPANTLVWTNYVLNGSTYVWDAGAVFDVYPVNDNSSISIALYVNGELSYQQTGPILTPTLPPDHPNATLPVPSSQSISFVVNSTLQAGAVVSLAIICATPLTIQVNHGPADGTYSYSSTSLPSSLPTTGYTEMSYNPSLAAFAP